MTGDEPFARAEVTELAKAFPPVRLARSLLRQAGYPEVALPAAPETSLLFWEQVSEDVANGVLPDGRRRIMKAALEYFPANPTFKAAIGPPNDGLIRVLVVGASPRGTDRIRWDHELKAISAADRGHLEVRSCPAASVLDLDHVRMFRPNLLHLICHGEGENLVFEDPDGEAHPVAAIDIVDTIAQVQDGRLLDGVLLRSCHGERVAGLFVKVAATVIAHRGIMDDTCGRLFADRFYRELARNRDLPVVARLAAREVANADQACQHLWKGLMILPD